MEDTNYITLSLQILAVLVLVFLNGFFVAAEFALVRLRETQLNPFIIAGDRRAKIAQYIVSHLDAFLSAAQLGITLASLALGWVGHPVFDALLEPLYHLFEVPDESTWKKIISTMVGFSVITFLHITAGEQAPKWYAIQKPLPTTLWVAYPMLWFYKLSYPFVIGLNKASQWMLGKVGIQPGDEHGDTHSEEEIRLMITASSEAAGASDLEKEMVLNSYGLKRRKARDVMIPRTEIAYFSTDDFIEDCFKLFNDLEYSRYPLVDEDDLDSIIGICHIKDLYMQGQTAQTGAELQGKANKPIYVAETARLVTVLDHLLKKKRQVAIVVDEYGGTSGMLTVEDILEEIVGPIRDEFDQDEKPLITRSGKRGWFINGALPLHEFSELVGEHIEEEGIQTVSGWLTQELGTFPERGQVLEREHYTLRVLELDDSTAEKIRVDFKGRERDSSKE